MIVSSPNKNLYSICFKFANQCVKKIVIRRDKKGIGHGRLAIGREQGEVVKGNEIGQGHSH